MRWLAKHDIPVIVLNWNGNLLSAMMPKEPNNGKLRVKQYDKYLDKKARYDIARALVEEKVNKGQDLLVGLSDYYDEVDRDETIKVFEFERDRFHKYKSADCDLNKLLLYESRIANRYFSTITRVINKLRPDFNFTGRGTKSYSWNMNASDPINALLNYGYAIAEAEARRAINSVGLDPYVGYLHELAGSKQPLVYDVQELGRWLVDLSIIQLLADHKLKKSAFVTTENYHQRLREDTAKLLLNYIRNNFNTAVPYKKKQFTYQYVLGDNVQMLANYISDRSKELRFNVPGVPIKWNDDNETRDFILNMTPDQRKELGINKSTLWYIQKNMREGKKVKLYEKVRTKIV